MAVYLEYAKTSNLVAVTVYLVTLLAAQTAQIGMWHWADMIASQDIDADLQQ